MGANAQTSVPTFTAGQILTADQQNQSARTGVPVFATTVTRDAAFGGTGEKTLAEGQMCYVEGTGFQTYNGTAWVTWGTSPSGGLDFISSTTIGSAVSSVTVSNAFSATYDNYQIIVAGTTGTGGQDLLFQLSGITGSVYAYAVQAMSNSGTFTNKGSAGATTMVVSGADSGAGNGFAITVCAPFLTTGRKNIFGSGFGNSLTYVLGGQVISTTSASGFVISTSTGTITGGTIKVYGYKN